jgi:hypothetical protein
MNLSGFALLLFCSSSSLFTFAISQWKADRNVRIEDAYKWTYQATRGGEHAVPDKESAREWLDGEWLTLGKPPANEQLWELLCPGGEIGRFNLRPFKAKSGDEDALLEAFLASSREYKSEGKNFVDAWMELGKRLKKRSAGKLDYRSWRILDTKLKAKNYPAIHHSEAYEKAHHPAYRVLTAAQYKLLMKR